MGKGRSILFGLVIAIVGVWALIGFWANLFVEALWFDQLSFSDVFWTILSAKFTIALVFGFTALAILGVNVYMARYLASRLTDQHLFNEELSELEQLFSASRLVDLVTVGGVLVISGILGVIGLADWDGILRYFNQVPFGSNDPIFGYDIGFFCLLSAVLGFRTVLAAPHCGRLSYCGALVLSVPRRRDYRRAGDADPLLCP